VRAINLDGDRQSDLTVHGGARKAVYVYPSEHYPFWRGALPDLEFPYGAFGENLTTSGLLEASVRIGDRVMIGTAAFVVTQPRMPCFKLVIRFGRPDMVKRFMKSGRSGFYLKVTREGVIETGDSIALNPDPDAGPTVSEVFGARRRD
jgi:MOSC domain-containing protein YiiM